MKYALAMCLVAAAALPAAAQPTDPPPDPGPATAGIVLLDGPATDPPLITVDDDQTRDAVLRLTYTFASGDHANATLTLPLPPWVTPALSGADAPFVFDGCPLSAGPGSERVCHWVAPTLSATSAEGVSGSFDLSVRLDRYRFSEGQPVDFVVTASSTFTAPGGSPEAITSAPASTRAYADPLQTLSWHSDSGIVNVGWTEHAGESGLLLRMVRRPAVDQSAKAFGVVATSRIGPGITVLGHESGTQWQFVSQDTLVDGTTEIVFAPTAGDIPEHFPDSSDTPAPFYVELFVPCSALVDGSTALYADPDYWAETTLGFGERFWQAEAPGYHDVARTFSRTDPMLTGIAACGTGGGLNKFDQQWWPAPEDGYALMAVHVTPPSGVATATDALIVDDLPPGVMLQGIWHTGSSQFALYGCNFDPASGDVTLTSFLERRDDDCEPISMGTIIMQSYTHMVAHTPTWGGTQTLQPVYLLYAVQIPLGYLESHPSTQLNTAYVRFGYTLDGEAITVAPSPALSLEDDPWKDDAPVTAVPNYACDESVSLGVEGSTTIAPGAPAPANQRTIVVIPRPVAFLGRYVDPEYTFELPAGVTAVSAEVRTPFGDVCPEIDPLNPVVAPTLPATGTLTWRWSGVMNHIPWAARCLDLALTIAPDPDGWVDGDQVTVTGQGDGANNSDAVHCNGPSAVHTFTMTVPAELRVDVAPDCSGNGGQPAFVVTTANSGGIHFTDAVVRFPIPAGTTLVGIDAFSGPTILCEVDGVVDLCAFPSADTDAVIVSGFDLAAPDQSLSFRVRLATTLPAFTQIHASATASVAELQAPASSTTASPFVVDDCRYEVAVTKFFDADGDGVEGAGDSRLANWAFTISPDGGTSGAATTDADGVARFMVRPGSYTVSEVMPPTVNGHAWFAHGGVTSRQVVVPVDPIGPVTATFANGCTCEPSQCAVAAGACTPDGCTWVDEPACDDRPVYHIQVDGPGGPAVVACTLDRTGPTPQLSCQPPSADAVAACGGTP